MELLEIGRRSEPLEQPPSSWVVYATFDRSGRRATHVASQLGVYRELGFGILVVDASESVSPQRRADWRELADICLLRGNVGYDFASYRAGVELLLSRGLLRGEDCELILANDSVYGPFSSLAEVLRTCRAGKPGTKRVCGITDSFQRGYHLQSYWLFFSAAAITDASEFLRGMPIARDREQAIRDGEIRFTSYVVSRGCEAVAHCPLLPTLEAAMERHGRALFLLELALRHLLGRPKFSRDGDAACWHFARGRSHALTELNPTLALGRYLHRSRRSPFVKRALVAHGAPGDAHIPSNLDGDQLDNAAVAALLR